MRRFIVVGVLVGTLVALSAASYASGTSTSSSKQRLTTTLTGYQEVPSKSTVGSGALELVIDEASQSIAYTLTYTVEQPPLFAHIHFAQRGVNGAIVADLCGMPGTPPCPGASGTVSDVIEAEEIKAQVPDQGIEAADFAEFVRALRAGHTYANVHTPRFPGGEIRGQINDQDQREALKP
jgi:hypothetical protein